MKKGRDRVEKRKEDEGESISEVNNDKERRGVKKEMKKIDESSIEREGGEENREGMERI